MPHKQTCMTFNTWNDELEETLTVEAAASEQVFQLQLESNPAPRAAAENGHAWARSRACMCTGGRRSSPGLHLDSQSQSRWGPEAQQVPVRSPRGQGTGDRGQGRSAPPCKRLHKVISDGCAWTGKAQITVPVECVVQVGKRSPFTSIIIMMTVFLHPFVSLNHVWGRTEFLHLMSVWSDITAVLIQFIAPILRSALICKAPWGTLGFSHESRRLKQTIYYKSNISSESMMYNWKCYRKAVLWLLRCSEYFACFATISLFTFDCTDSVSDKSLLIVKKIQHMLTQHDPNIIYNMTIKKWTNLERELLKN